MTTPASCRARSRPVFALARAVDDHRAARITQSATGVLEERLDVSATEALHLGRLGRRVFLPARASAQTREAIVASSRLR
jgi:hypothetical protein